MAAVAVVAVLAVLFLGFGGWIPGYPGAPNSVGSDLRFSEAYSAANASARSAGGAGWDLASAIGIDVPDGGNYPASDFVTGPCGSLAPPPLIRSPVGDPASGVSPYWSFTFVAPVNNSTQTVVVASGRAVSLGIAPPESGCLPIGPVPVVAAPSHLQDSDSVARSLTPGLSQFLDRFPNSSLTFSLQGTTARGAFPQWVVDASPCRTSANGSANVTLGDPEYVGRVNGTGPQVFENEGVPAIGRCLAPGSLGSQLVVQTSRVVAGSPGVGYPLLVRSSSPGLAVSSITPYVVPNPHATSSPANATLAPTGFELLNSTHAVLATYDTFHGAWTSGGATPIQAGDWLELTTGYSIGGAILVLIANSPDTGEIPVVLP